MDTYIVNMFLVPILAGKKRPWGFIFFVPIANAVFWILWTWKEVYDNPITFQDFFGSTYGDFKDFVEQRYINKMVNAAGIGDEAIYEYLVNDLIRFCKGSPFWGELDDSGLVSKIVNHDYSKIENFFEIALSTE